MDIALELCDTFFFDYAYSAALPASPAPEILKDGFGNSTIAALKAASSWRYAPASQYLSWRPRDAAWTSQWPRDNIYRQTISLFLIMWLAGALIYFIIASLSYHFIFDKATFKHPKFLKNQVRLEISQAVYSMPFMSALTAPFFLLEVRGYSKLYDAPAEAPFPMYNWLQFPLFLLFTDCFVYFIHRGLHHPYVYKTLHKPHHKWIMPTPFAAIAFHPVDGWAQSIPYHVFPLIFPLQKWAYLALFVFIQIWTVFIHDGEYVANSPLINGAACHSLHHSRFEYNYGQYTTMWDRIGGSYLRPADEMFEKDYLKKLL